MRKYTSNPWLRGVAALALTVIVLIIWKGGGSGDGDQASDGRGVTKFRKESPENPGSAQNSGKDGAENPVPTAEKLAAMSMEDRLDALAAFYEKHGFAAATALLSGFSGDQEIYQATKMLALLASQKEPTAVFNYLATNDAYLLSDQDVMLSLMGASSELFPIEEATKYAAMMPAGASRFQAYNYLSQIMADPAHSAKIPVILSTVKDRGVLSYLERSLPAALLRSGNLADAIRQVEELERYGEFNNRNDFVDAGALLARKHGHTMEGLAELEGLGGDKASALFQGYIEELLGSGQHTYDLLDYTFGRYLDQLDDGALLATVFKRALAADPGLAISKLREAGIESADLDALVTRNFINFTENHPAQALGYINGQADPQVRDNLLSTYGLTQKHADTELIRDIESRISDPHVKRTYLLDSTVKISAQAPREIYGLIMDYASPALRQDMIAVNLLPIAIQDMDLGISMAQAVQDPQSRGAALYSLLEIAGNNEEQGAKITRALEELQQQADPSQPGN